MSSVNTLRVGQKVECLDAKHSWLVEGATYVIESMEGGFVSLVGVMPMTYGPSKWFKGRFKPLVETREAADIALFLSIANEAEKPLVNLTDALNLAWELYGVEE